MPSVTTVDEIAPMQPMLTLKDKPTAAQQLANIKPPEERARVYNTIPGIKRRLTAKFKVAERLIKTANQIINYSADTEAYYAVVKRVCNILQTYIHSFKNITDEVEGILSISPMLNPTTEIREKNLARMIEWIEASNIQQMLSELEKLNNQGLEMLEVFATNLEQGHSPSPKEDTGSPEETELEKFETLADDPEQLTNELMDWDNIDEISTTNLDDITSPVNVNKEILETRNNASSSSFSQAQSLTAAAQRNTTIGSLHIQPLLEHPPSADKNRSLNTESSRQQHQASGKPLNSDRNIEDQLAQLVQLCQDKADETTDRISRIERVQMDDRRTQNQLIKALSDQIAKLSLSKENQRFCEGLDSASQTLHPHQLRIPPTPIGSDETEQWPNTQRSYHVHTSTPAANQNSYEQGLNFNGTPTNPQSTTATSNQNHSFNTTTAAHIHGLVSSIPKFDGNKDEYKLFKTMFTNLVHNTNLDPTLKQTVLLQALTGNARICITSTDVSAEDYDSLREELEMLYGNSTDRLDRNEMLYKNLPFHQTSYVEMEKDLLKHVSAVNALKREGVSINCKTFIQVMIDKLPQELMRPANKLVRKIRQATEQGGPALTFMAVFKSIQENIREFAAEQLMDQCKRNRTTCNEILAINTNQPDTPRNTNQRGMYRWTQKTNTSPAYTLPCRYCNDSNHCAKDCNLSHVDRAEAVRRNNLCNNCLGNNHTTIQCHSRYNCANCRQRHHTFHCTSTRGSSQKFTSRWHRPAPQDDENSHAKANHFNTKGRTSGEKQPSTPTFPAENVSIWERSPTLDDGILSSKTSPIIPRVEFSCENGTFASGDNNIFKIVNPNGPAIKEIIVEDAIETFTFNTELQRDSEYKMPFMPLSTTTGNILLALVDTGATTSIISEVTAKKLGLQIVKKQLMSFKGLISSSEQQWYNFYQLKVTDSKHRLWAASIPGYTKLPTIFRSPILSLEDQMYMKNHGLDVKLITRLSRYDGQPIDLLLGNNVISHLVKDSRRFILPSGRLIEQTPLGLITYPTPIPNVLSTDENVSYLDTSSYHQEEHIYTVDSIDFASPEDDILVIPTSPNNQPQQISNAMLDKQLAQMWNLDVLGILPPEAMQQKTLIDEELIDQFKKNATTDKDNKVYVAFPLNGREKDLFHNYPVAARRLTTLLNNQLRTGTTRMQYHDIIMSQLESGIIERVEDKSPTNEDGNSYFIPHRVVIKLESTTTKLRIVLDASSHMKNELSLNDCVFPGPSILQSILGILLRSRLKKYLMISDIEKAFHQVRIQPQYRNLTKFLWLKDPALGYNPDNIAIYRFTRLPFGVACSPFLLAITILRYLEQNPDEINQRVTENLYVDNILFTTNKIEELKKLYEDSKNAFNKMHMNLREFMINCIEVMEQIPEKDRANNHITKLLGHIWNAELDTLTIKIAQPPDGIPTKRQLASFQAKTYDPTGMVCPILIPIKNLMHKLWIAGTKWNEPLPTSLEKDWKKAKLLFDESELVLPRQLVNNYNYKTVSLIIFSDASKDHYGLAAYLRYDFGQDVYNCRLIFAKSKIRPAKTELTIPQMELLGVEIATNAAATILKELHMKIDSVTFFCDNVSVLYWILHRTNGTRWVEHRVKKIRTTLGSINQDNLKTSLRYIPTDQNPADIATRGCSVSELKASKIWFTGPQIMLQNQNTWPKKLDDTPADPHLFHDFSQGKEPRSLTRIRPATNETTECLEILNISACHNLESIVPYACTNSLVKLSSIIHLTLQWITNAVKKRNERFPDDLIQLQGRTLKQYQNAVINNNEVEKRVVARQYIIRAHYDDAAQRLHQYPPKEFEPMLDENEIYRKTTNFANAPFPRDHREPIIILKKHPLAYLIAREVHMFTGHQGYKESLAEFQRRYASAASGQLIRHICSRCTICKKRHGRAYKYPFAKTIPRTRTEAMIPFAHIGIDYFGPIKYKTTNAETNQTGIGKMWVFLATCIVTRAVHLECVMDNSTRQFLLALRRFVARRGAPETILSDNAPTFVLGLKMINTNVVEFVNQSRTLTNYLASKEIAVKQITPYSPWQGGIYERIVGIVKSCLYKIIGPANLTFLELETIIIECEGMANNRPITRNAIDASDSLAIRPSDFLMPSVQMSFPDEFSSMRERVLKTIQMGTTEKLTRMYLHGLDRLLTELWNVFHQEYFSALQQRRPTTGHYCRIKPKPGHIVHVKTNNLLPRNHWPLGRIMSLNKSQDQQVRSAVVKCGKELLERPINQLVPLECPELNDNASLDELQQLATIPQPTVPPILFNENSERTASTTSHFSTTSPQPMHFSQQLQ